MKPLKKTIESVETAVEKWIKHAQRFTPRTQGHYRIVIRRFIKSLPPEIETIDQLDGSLIGQYIDSLLGKWINRTANAHLTAIKSFNRWLSENYDVPNYAAKIKMMRESPPEPRVLSWSEYQRILSVCQDGEADIIRLLANTGLRSSEMLNLRWHNVDQDFKMLTVVGKGRKRRVIPINQVVRDILLKYPRESDDCFVGLIRNSQNRNCLYQLCERLLRRPAIKEAGLKRFGPHAFRHLFATEMLRRGVPITHVSLVLGHASIETTQRQYMHFTPMFLTGLTDILLDDKGETNG